MIHILDFRRNVYESRWRGDWELTVVSVGCFESSRYCTGVEGASKVFRGRGSLKAQGDISSWVPELDPKSLGDSNAGGPFLQVLSVGREAERAPPVCQKYCQIASIFNRTKRPFLFRV